MSYSISVTLASIVSPCFLEKKKLGQLNSNFKWRLLKVGGGGESYSYGLSRMIKMPSTPIHGKTFFSMTRRPMAMDLCRIGDACEPYHVWSNNDPMWTLAYFYGKIEFDAYNS